VACASGACPDRTPRGPLVWGFCQANHPRPHPPVGSPPRHRGPSYAPEPTIAMPTRPRRDECEPPCFARSPWGKLRRVKRASRVHAGTSQARVLDQAVVCRAARLGFDPSRVQRALGPRCPSQIRRTVEKLTGDLAPCPNCRPRPIAAQSRRVKLQLRPASGPTTGVRRPHRAARPRLTGCTRCTAPRSSSKQCRDSATVQYT